MASDAGAIKAGSGGSRFAADQAAAARVQDHAELSRCQVCGSLQTRVRNFHRRTDGSVRRRHICEACGVVFFSVSQDCRRLPRVEVVRAALATERACTSCLRTLPVSAFGKVRSGSPLLRPSCNECLNRKRSAYALKEACVEFGITAEQYDAMYRKQDGRCAICGTKDPGDGQIVRPKQRTRWRYMRIDHCHATGKVRGLLCNKCNLGIGNFNDEPERLEAAATYVRRHAGSPVIPSTEGGSRHGE